MLKKIRHNMFVKGFTSSPLALLSLILLSVLFIIAIFAPLVAPYDTLDMATLDLMDADLPPAWQEGGDARFLLGTDDQGRDLLSAIIHGTQLSLYVATLSVLLSMSVGVLLGLIAGYFGGFIDSLIMRIVDIKVSLPSILIALLVNGIAIASMSHETHEEMAALILVVSIAIATWINYTRIIRSATMVQAKLEYVQAAKIMGFGHFYIIFRHILPNVATPIFVLVAVDFGICIVLEAALSFLGVGLPSTLPSLGTLIRIGSDYLFSGQWWIVTFAGGVLFLIVVFTNIVGDRLRDILNPKIDKS